jgi:glycogen synthase
MRVLHLTPEFPPVIWGGLGTAVGGLVTASARAGMTIGVLLVGGTLVMGRRGYGSWHPSMAGATTSDRLQAMVEGGSVVFFQVTPADALEAGIRLVRQWRPDIIHLHTAWLWPVAHALQEVTGAPLIFTVHSLDRAEYEIGEFINQWEVQDAVIAEADRLITLSRSERDLLIAYYPEAHTRVRIIGNGIDDCPKACEAVRKGALRGGPMVLYTGRFVLRKGIRELLEAIPIVLDQAPTTQFVLIGGYGGGAEIERSWLTEVLRPYSSHVHFTGWLAPDEVADWYGTADLLVVPSWYEPFGMVVLEGMLYGLPVAACAVGGPAEILEHERTGLLFPAKDVKALARALLRLVTNPDLRQQIGAAAAEEVRRKWLWPHIVKKVWSVYQEAMYTRSQVLSIYRDEA